MFNTVLTLISAICTAITVIGAFKAVKYYKKSRLLTAFASQNAAYSESLTIISAISEILQAEKRITDRGTNRSKSLSEIGLRIRSSLNIIRTNCSSDVESDIVSLIDSKSIMGYINILIVDPPMWNGKPDSRFEGFQKKIYELHDLIKKKRNDSADLLA